jgi:hypothetical protein
MGVDYNAVKLLLWAKKLGVSFERTLTLGRQGFDCPPGRLQKAVSAFGLPATKEEIDHCFDRASMGPLMADGFFRFLGAKELISVDYSDFEGATLLHDLNEPFPKSQHARFTFVFDGGTLEHIFNYPAALRHSLELVASDGHFLTIAPSHCSMGHGFYQISPELFFRVFRAENGFALRKLVLFASSKTDAPFFQVKDPAVTRRRTNLVSADPMQVAALAQRTALMPILAQPPQQSDYAAHWEQHLRATGNPGGTGSGRLWRIRSALNLYWPYALRRWKATLLHRRHRGGRPKLSNRNHFRRVSRQELFQGQEEPPS